MCLNIYLIKNYIDQKFGLLFTSTYNPDLFKWRPIIDLHNLSTKYSIFVTGTGKTRGAYFWQS